MVQDYQLKVYVYYYPWYTGRHDYKWDHCQEYSPYLGLYDSSYPDVVRQHIEWAIEYGINGFLIEWFGFDSEFGNMVDANTTVLRSVLYDYPEFEFAIFYDQAIRFGKRRFADPLKRQTFLDDLEFASTANFAHPNYMRIDGRPVVVIYLTRGSSDNYAALLEDGRRRMEGSARAGRPFLVGDEIWWSEKTQYFNALDAVTSYNMHNDKQLKLVNGNVRDFAAHVAEFYALMQPVASGFGTDFFPGIGHAYNDEIIRGNLPIIPFVEEGGLPQYRGDMIECMKAQQLVWKDNPRFRQTGEAYIFITSFNEWPERSVVEPTSEIETYNKIYDFRKGKYIYLQPPRFEYLEGIKEGKQQIENNILPNL